MLTSVSPSPLHKTSEACSIQWLITHPTHGQLSFKVPKLFLTQHANGWINLAHVILVTASAPILIGHLATSNIT